MKKILMVLTHNRLDCLRLALDLLIRQGEAARFDHIVFLLNGVSAGHMAGVDAYIRAHPELNWDKVLGDGTRPTGIVAMQNTCIRRYPHALYTKIDEDVFVGRGWAEGLFSAYAELEARGNLALISPLIPNNGLGLHTLLTRFHPEALAAFRARFGRDPDPERQGHTWHQPAVAAWATRQFLSLDAANARQRERLAASGQPRLMEFNRSFSIGCICYDYRHWEAMGGIPPTDEPGWCDWIEKNGAFNVLDCSQLVLHYAFFVQQEWLDRSSLLEDIRRANLPDTLRWDDYGWKRAVRLAQQVPSVLKRRFGRKG